MRIRSQSEVVDTIRATHLSEDAKSSLWEQIEGSLESDGPVAGSPRLASGRGAKRRRLLAELVVGAAGIAVVVGAGMYVWQQSRLPSLGGGGPTTNKTSNQTDNSVSNASGNTMGNSAGNSTDNGTGTENTASNSTGPGAGQVQLPVLHSFSNAAVWRRPDTSPYVSGVTTVATPLAPSAYEEALRPQSGVAELQVSPTQGSINADQTTNPNAFGPRWTQTIRFTSRSLDINGQTYTVPAAYSKQKLLVLPIGGGIVWCVSEAGSPAPVRPTSKLLDGATAIYYTPYMPHGGSLMTGAVKIASVPHRWMGIDGPTIASAWTGWLPSTDVIMPKVKSDTVMNETFGPTIGVPTRVSPAKGAIPGWPTAFMRDLTKRAYYKAPHYAAYVQSLTRTNGGFVLTVWFADATMSGRNAGMSGANYYWSEKTRKWTPIDQTYTVQILPGWTDLGSDGVYEMQPLGVGNGSGNEFDVAEMHFDPATLTMSSVWLGDWIYGPSFVDGNSWVAVLSQDMSKSANAAPNKWTVYTP